MRKEVIAISAACGIAVGALVIYAVPKIKEEKDEINRSIEAQGYEVGQLAMLSLREGLMDFPEIEAVVVAEGCSMRIDNTPDQHLEPYIGKYNQWGTGVVEKSISEKINSDTIWGIVENFDYANGVEVVSPVTSDQLSASLKLKGLCVPYPDFVEASELARP